MDLERLIRHLKGIAEDPANANELGRLARDLGHSLHSATLQQLRELRAESAAVRDALEDQSPAAAFAKGLLFGLVEMVVAYEVEVQARGEREELRRFVGQRVHLGILRFLEESPGLPGDLARSLSTSDAQVSRALRELRAMGLVDGMTPATLGDQRTRPQRLTSEGRALLQILGGEEGGRGAGLAKESSPDRQVVMSR